MKKRSKQLAALFLSVVMAMTSVDGTAFVMASDSTEMASETGWEHDQGQTAESSSETEIVTEAVSEESEPDLGGARRGASGCFLCNGRRGRADSWM